MAPALDKVMTQAERGRKWYERKQLSSGFLFSVFSCMKARCYEKKHQSFKSYGDSGVTICAEWLDDPELFFRWGRGQGYRRGLQIDRIDNAKGYSPDNCRFVTGSQNCLNKRRREIPSRPRAKLTMDQANEVRKLSAEGVPQREIGRRFGISHATVWAIKSGRTWIGSV